jgi:hypothetical protein
MPSAVKISVHNFFCPIKKCSTTEPFDGQCSETPSDCRSSCGLTSYNICSIMLVLGKYVYLPLLVTSAELSQPHFKEMSVYFQEQIFTTVPLKLHKLEA